MAVWLAAEAAIVTGHGFHEEKVRKRASHTGQGMHVLSWVRGMQDPSVWKTLVLGSHHLPYTRAIETFGSGSALRICLPPSNGGVIGSWSSHCHRARLPWGKSAKEGFTHGTGNAYIYIYTFKKHIFHRMPSASLPNHWRLQPGWLVSLFLLALVSKGPSGYVWASKSSIWVNMWNETGPYIYSCYVW